MIMDLSLYQPKLDALRLLIPGDQPLPDTLVQMLEKCHLEWDQATTVEEARHVFFVHGGHTGILVPPFCSATIPRNTIRSLRQIDPGIPILTFLDPGVLNCATPAPTLLNPGELGGRSGRNHLLRQFMSVLGLQSQM